jgi:tetratricopeptide (TPR) repeat protein
MSGARVDARSIAKRERQSAQETKHESPNPVDISRQRKTQFVIAVLLALATFIAYARALNSDFIYLDDRTYVTENATVQKGLTWEGVKWAISTVHGSNWHPLTWLSHMLDWSLYGPNPRGHHFTNLVLHVVNVVLLFYALCRMTGAVWASAFVAGAFGLHPAHVESVAWVAERKDVLSTCLGLLTVIAYVRYVEVRSASRYLLLILMFALSLCAKPMMVTLPFVLLLLDYWPLGRASKSTFPSAPSRSRLCLETDVGTVTPWWRLVVEKVPLFILAAGSSAVTVYAQRAGGAMMTEAMLPTEARISNAIVSYAKYLWMTFWPAGLAVYYPHPLQAPPVGLVTASALLLLAATVGVVALRRKRPYLLVGWFWFLGMLVPVIGLVQVGGQAMADRYTYLPIVGLFIMAAWGIGFRQQGNKAPRQQTMDSASPPCTRIGVPPAIGALILVVLGIVTYWQVGYWRDSMTLFQRAIDVVPENPQAHIFMANTLIRQGKVGEAVPHFAEAVRIVPSEPYNLTDYAHALLDSGKVDEAAARLEGALTLLPKFADAHYFLGLARVKQGRNAEAVGHLEKSLANDPKLLGAHLHLGSAFAAQGQWTMAISHLQKWLLVDPRSVEGLTKLAQCYHSVGNEAAAKETLQKAAEADPKNPYPVALMAQMAAWSGQVESAISLYQQALQVDPRYAEAANNLALILATHPEERFRDGVRAVQLAEIAATAQEFKDPVSLDTLAAAYAEVGRFSDALRTVDSAIGLGRAMGSTQFIEHLEKRRALYVAGKPARAE